MKRKTGKVYAALKALERHFPSWDAELFVVERKVYGIAYELARLELELDEIHVDIKELQNEKVQHKPRHLMGWNEESEAVLIEPKVDDPNYLSFCLPPRKKKIKYCSDCNGKGWIEVEDALRGKEIQKCDACDMFPDDQTAKEAKEFAEKSLRRKAKTQKPLRIYHWDTFDNESESILIGAAPTLKKAEAFVQNRYKGRINIQGADQVDIVDGDHNILKSFKVC